DIVFIAGNGTALNVAHAVPGAGVPPEELERYRSDGPARYVLELPRGGAARAGIDPGDHVAVGE
ncbi:MAG: DUF192 domain-containing protein, partial [Halodesulfurarchaeum sp.]